MKVVISLILSFFYLMVFSQDTYVQQGGEKFEGKAKYYFTTKYAPAFYLSGEQTVLFEKKLIEFLIREEKIRSVKMSDRDRLKTLTQPSIQETPELGNILNRRQLRTYVKLKKKFQPLVLVVGGI